MAGSTVLGLVKSCIGTKFTSQFGDLIAVSICNIKLHFMDVSMTFVLFDSKFSNFDRNFPMILIFEASTKRIKA